MNKVLFIAIISLLTLSSYAKESLKNPVTITLKSYQQEISINKKGKRVTKWLKPSKVVPGSIIKYQSTITNSTNKTLKNATLMSKIDKNLIFIPNSIKSKLTYEVEFSVDGKHFAKPNKLQIVGKDGKKHLATAKDYRAIKFTLFDLPKEATISYQTKVK